MSTKWKVVLTLIIALLIAGIIRKFVLEAFIVRGDSMSPTIVDGDYIFINRLAYLFTEPERGDVIIALSRNPENRIVKRVIGLPGERLEIYDGRVSIRGNRTDPYSELKEDYLTLPGHTYGTTTIKLDPLEYFALGDNREVSIDSRNLGPVDKWDVKGQVFLIFSLKDLKLRKL